MELFANWVLTGGGGVTWYTIKNKKEIDGNDRKDE